MGAIKACDLVPVLSSQHMYQFKVVLDGINNNSQNTR